MHGFTNPTHPLQNVSAMQLHWVACKLALRAQNISKRVDRLLFAESFDRCYLPTFGFYCGLSVRLKARHCSICGGICKQEPLQKGSPDDLGAVQRFGIVGCTA